MTETPPESVPNRIRLTASPEAESGVYADFAAVWHHDACFVLDFAALVRPPEVVEDEDGTAHRDLTVRLVSRVRVPPSQIFEIMKALEQQLSAWERETGRR
jgi:hypothetical protein